MRFSMILEMVDRASAPGKRAKAAVKSLTGSVREIQREMRKARRDVTNGTRSVQHFERRARRIRRVALARTLQDAANGARRLGNNLDRAVAKLRLTERAGKAAKRGLRGLGSRLMGGIQIAGAAAVGGGAFAALNTLRTTGQFEQYQVMLEGIEGSAQAARRSMDWVREFTARTPFELQQVMEGFVALKAYGIDPANGSLTALGDASAAMSEPLMQGVEALADAVTGEFERLKQFGIRASKEGNRVAFTFRKNGQDIRREADFTGSAIEEALVGIFNDRFGGGAERQSRTMFGILSNLSDKWTGFQVDVGEAGIFNTVKGDLKTLLDEIEAMSASGELSEWAKDISDGLEDAWGWGKKFVKETDWRSVGRALTATVEALTSIVTWLGRAVKLADDIAQGDTMRIKPQRTLPRKPSDPFTLFRFKSSRSNDNGMGPPRLRNAPRQSSRANRVEVSGKTVVDIRLADGLSARTRSVSSKTSSVPVEVRTGKAMRSAA